MSTTVVVPVKSFGAAKARLAGHLGPAARTFLAQCMAERVLAACGGLAVTVVCDDEEVARWASANGAAVAWTPGRGLNGAVQSAVETVAADPAVERVIVAHADLPRATTLARLAPPNRVEVLLVPDRRLDGTNVLSIPARCGFVFAYGSGSFERHRAQATRLGLVPVVVTDDDLAVDIDLPEDLPLLPPELLAAVRDHTPALFGDNP